MDSSACTIVLIRQGLINQERLHGGAEGGEAVGDRHQSERHCEIV